MRKVERMDEQKVELGAGQVRDGPRKVCIRKFGEPWFERTQKVVLERKAGGKLDR